MLSCSLPQCQYIQKQKVFPVTSPHLTQAHFLSWTETDTNSCAQDVNRILVTKMMSSLPLIDKRTSWPTTLVVAPLFTRITGKNEPKMQVSSESHCVLWHSWPCVLLFCNRSSILQLNSLVSCFFPRNNDRSGLAIFVRLLFRCLQMPFQRFRH